MIKWAMIGLMSRRLARGKYHTPPAFGYLPEPRSNSASKEDGDDLDGLIAVLVIELVEEVKGLAGRFRIRAFKLSDGQPDGGHGRLIGDDIFATHRHTVAASPARRLGPVLMEIGFVNRFGRWAPRGRHDPATLPSVPGGSGIQCSAAPGPDSGAATLPRGWSSAPPSTRRASDCRLWTLCHRLCHRNSAAGVHRMQHRQGQEQHYQR